MNDNMDGFPSGQRGQTVNLLTTSSKVQILLHPLLQINNAAGWSSLEARWAHNPKVVGSNPTPATMTKSYSKTAKNAVKNNYNIVRKECFAFLFHAQIAQLVEQRTENPCVAGSTPALGTSQLSRKASICKGLQTTLNFCFKVFQTVWKWYSVKILGYF